MSRKPLKKSLPLACLALLLLGAPRNARAQLHLGVEAGWDSGCKDAVEGFPNATFRGSTVLGGSLGYRFGFGLDLEVAFLQLSPKLVENGVELATVTLAPVLLRLGYRWIPPARGWGGRLALGFGAVGSSFKKGPFLRDLERQAGVVFDEWPTGDSFAFDMVGGGEYFVVPWLSLGVDARLLIARRGTRWQVSGSQASVPVQDIETYVLLSGEISGVVRLWLRR